MKMKSLHKSFAPGLLAAGMLFLGMQAGQATVTQVGTIEPFSGNPDDEIAAIKDAFYTDGYCLEYLAKFEDDDSFEGDFGDFFTVDIEGPLASVSWDLSGTGFLLKNIAVKSGQNGNIYEVAPDQGLIGSADVASGSFNDKGEQQDISHISFYGCEVPDGGATVALLGLALLGLSVGRRFKRA